MRQAEPVTLTSRSMTFIVGQKRLIDSILTSSGLNYTEFCILLALLETQEAALVENLADFLILKPRTVISSLASLEEKGLIRKQDAGEGGRKMYIFLSENGRTRIEKTVREVNRQNAETLHGSLPTDELQRVMLPRIKYAVDKLRGHSSDAFPTRHCANSDLGIDHFILWRALITQWTEEVHAIAGISLGEYRLLSLLLETGETNQSSACQRLMMQKSKVSDHKARLLKIALIEEAQAADDAREVLLHITKKGERTARRCESALKTTWENGHSGLSEEETLIVEAWYARMYGNLVKASSTKNRTIKGTNI